MYSERGRGNGKRLKEIIAVFIVAALMSPYIGSQVPPPPPFPYAIYGYVVDEYGNGIDSVNVSILNNRTGDILYNLTNSQGAYLFDISNFPNGWMVGDLLIITARKVGYKENATSIIVDGSYAQQASNITLYQVVNHPPYKPSLIEPADGSKNISVNPTLKVYVEDPDGNLMNVYFYNAKNVTNSSDDELIDAVYNVGNGTVSIIWQNLSYDTTYYWYVVANDTQYENVSEIWNFTTGYTFTYYVEFGEPHANITYENKNFTAIKVCTPMWINATKGAKWLNYSVWWNATSPNSYEKLYEMSVMDNDANDGDPRDGYISAELHFNEGCFHEIKWIITDYLGRKSPQYSLEIAVDDEEPLLSREIGEPNYDDGVNPIWVSCSTPIWINATDKGCGGGVGVWKIGIDVYWNETMGEGQQFTLIDSIVVEDNGPLDLDDAYGKISFKFNFSQDCFHEPEFWAIDYVGNLYTVKEKYLVDCKPPAIRKDISKVVALGQEEMNTSAIVNEISQNDYQSFVATWSYIDAISVYLSGTFDGSYDTWVEIYNESMHLLASSEHISIDGAYTGWLQFHFPDRLFVNVGELYWLQLRTTQYSDIQWYASNENPYPDGYAIVNGIDNYSWDFAFKIEYYPIYPYFYPMEYTLFNETEQHDGLNGTWLTSEATLVLDSWDEGCMGGVGLDSLQYRIWNGTWTPWINYTAPFSIPDECKHYVEIKAVDKLGNVRIINQTHWVDNSPPEAEVEFSSTHGYYYDNATGKIFLRACKGFWINVTDKPECAVGVRDFILYWRYEYTNFTTPYMEKHPEDVNDTEYGVPVFINGEWWWKMEAPEFSAYLHFKEECMHKIFYFYEASDLLDNSVESEVENITIYVDANDPEVYKEHPEHGYIPIDNTTGYISDKAKIVLTAKDLPDVLKIVEPYQTEGMSQDTLQVYNETTTPWPWDAQTFISVADYIDEIKLRLNWSGPAYVTVYIHNATTFSPNNVLGSSTIYLNNSGDGWQSFIFSPAIEVKAGEIYYIEVHRSANSSLVRWYYIEENRYTEGNATISGEGNETSDWTFQVLRYTANPCASGIEEMYFGYIYDGVWHPVNETDNVSLYGEVVNISVYYNDSKIQSVFGGHYLWYEYNESIGIKFNEGCIHKLYYWAKDNVCHHSKVYNQTYYVDDLAPKIEVEYPKHGYSPVYAHADRADIAFIVDTSGSMNDEWNVLDSVMQALIDNITAQGVDLNVTIYGLDYNASSLPYGRGMYTVWYNGTNVSAHSEDWGPGTSWAALWHRWRDGALRIVIPISDENAYHGSPETSEDLFSIQEAISLCQNNSVVVYPFHGDFPGYVNTSSVLKEMWMLANGTGGEVFYFGNASLFINSMTKLLTEYKYLIGESLRKGARINLTALDKPTQQCKLVDQQQQNGEYAISLGNQHMKNMQSFVPSVDEISAIKLLLNGSANVNLSLYDENFTLVAYSLMSINANEPTWYQFHFNGVISLNEGLTYYIDVVADNTAYWYYANDSYSYGHAFINGEWNVSKDFAFKTEYYGECEAGCSAGLEAIYWRYVYNNISHPIDENDNVSLHGKVVNLSKYYDESDIVNYLWYEYNDSLGISFYEECEHELYFFAKDNVCHHSAIYYKRIFVDNSTPVLNKIHPEHGYDVAEGKEYLRKGANITIVADDLKCSSGTWLYYRFENQTGEYPYYKFEGFEGGIPSNWYASDAWTLTNISHNGNYSVKTNSSFIGAYELIARNISLPNVTKIDLIFWHKAENVYNDTAINSLRVYIYDENITIPLKYFSYFDGTLPQNWTEVKVDLTQFANKTIDIIWTYSNAYDKGEEWYIDDVEIIGWYGAYGWNNISVNISFNECWHKLYYFAKDQVCHSTEIYSQEYYVDGTPPETNHDVIKYGYRPPGIICVKDEIEIIANNSGIEPCIYPYIETYYRWEWKDENGTWHYYPDASHPQAINGSEIAVSEHADKISPYYWLLYNGTFNFTEGCEHKLYYFSKDGLCNTEEPKEWDIGVDNEAPETKMEFEGIYYKVNEEAVYIRNDTIIWLNATDLPNYPNCTTGVNYTMYGIWKYNYDKHGWDMIVSWRSTNDAKPKGVYVYWFGNGTSERRISIKIVLSELMEPYLQNGTYDTDCGKYEIHWYSVDYNPFIENEHDVDVIVDCTPPNATKEFGEPVIEDDLYGETIHWITSSTPIWINGTDDKIWDSGIWKVCIKYKRVDEVEFTQQCINGSSGVFYINGSDGKYRIFHWAIDNVGHASDYNSTKQHVILDNTPPSSRVADIIPWEREETPFDITVINITDNGPFGGVGVCKVEVYYSYSVNNISWSSWMLYAVNESLITLPDGSIKNWTLSFEALNGSGYYRLISIAYDCLGNKEQPPYAHTDYDALCYIPLDVYSPVVGKEYGEPSIEWNFAQEMGHAITSYTPIYLNATDMPDADNATGVDKICISFDGINWYNITTWTVIEPGASGSYKVSYVFTPADYNIFTEGIAYNMFYKAIDKGGHMSQEEKQKFVIDNTPPSTSIVIEGNETMPFNITVNTTDNVVGVEKIKLYYRYSQDGITWTDWAEYGTAYGNHTWEFNYAPAPYYYKPGYYEFYVYAEDKLGNAKAIPNASTAAEASCYVAPIKEDFNADGRVNVEDLYYIIINWDKDTSSPDWNNVQKYDLSGNGKIDAMDIYKLILKWTG